MDKERFDTSAFDLAAAQAKNDLETKISKMTPEELRGVTIVQAWLKQWYMTAGLKRPASILRDLK